MRAVRMRLAKATWRRLGSIEGSKAMVTTHGENIQTEELKAIVMAGWWFGT